MATESFFSAASLAYLASAGAGKDGKAYSIKPTDGTGDFTFSRGSNLTATRVGPTGLIEKGRENLLLQSNNFGTTWFNVRSTETGGQTDKDGGSTAWLLESTDASTSYIQQNVSSSGVQTFSVIAKKGTTDYIYLLVFGSNLAGQYFDLNNGTLANPVYTTIGADIEDLGNGWYRCSLFFQSNVTHVTIYPADSGTSSLSAVGSNVYIQDAQLEVGLAATDYIESGASTGKAGLLENEPRFDYSGGATCPSLLLEPSRTNLVPQSEYFDDWIQNFSSLTANQGISPEGVKNAYLYQASSSSRYVVFKTISVVSGTTYTLSMWVKSNSGTQKIRIGADNTCSNPQGAETFEIGTEWQRISTTITSTQTSWNLFFDNIESGIACTGTQLSADLLIYGFQIEAGSYPTSYIPNHSGGSATRTIDVAGVTGASSIIGQSEGTIYWEGYIDVSKSNYGYFPRLFSVSSTSTNWLALLLTQSNQLRAQYVVNGSADVKITHQISTSGNYKIAFAYNDNDFNCFVNGVSVGTNTTATTTIALNDIYLGMENGETLAPTSQDTKQALLFPTRLSNTDLATLTTL